jgi:uncharacterized membrane protein YeaQ/YmgE (transglycosylase-associated protein family)
MGYGASHNPFSGMADALLSPLTAKGHVRLRSTMSVKRDVRPRERQSDSVGGWNNGDGPALPGVPSRETNVMHLSNQSLLIILVVGIVAGWLAGRVMEGGGFGLVGDLIVGLIGAFIGDWLLPRLGIHLGVGIVALIINAFIGAVVLLLLLRLLGGGYRRGWGRRRI